MVTTYTDVTIPRQREQALRELSAELERRVDTALRCRPYITQRRKGNRPGLVRLNPLAKIAAKPYGARDRPDAESPLR